MEIIPSLRMWEFAKFFDKVNRLSQYHINTFRVNLKTLSNYKEYDSLMKVILETIDRIGDVSFIIDVDMPNESPRIVIYNKDYYNISKNEEIVLKFGIPEEKDCDKTLYVRGGKLKNIDFSDVRYIIYSSGNAVFKVAGFKQNDIILTAEQDCVVWSGKSIHFDNGFLIPGVALDTEKNFIDNIPNENICAIALSFTQSSSQLDEAVKIFGNHNYMCKIEDACGVDNIEKICNNSSCEGVYIGRGDLLFASIEKDFLELQERCARIANEHNKKVIIGTDILESMLEKVFPSRSDMTDWCCIKRLNPFGIVLSAALSYSNNIENVIEFINKGLKYF